MDKSFKINQGTIFFSFLTQLLLYGSYIIIMPFILSYIDGAKLGIWYIFVAIAGISSLIDFGFSAALSRNISFAFSGAKEIIKEGSPKMSENREIDFFLISSLLYTSKKVYFIIAAIIMIVLCSVGTIYVLSVISNKQINYLIPLWLTYSFSISINYYFNYVNVFIRGRGMISLSNKVIIISKAFFIIITLFLFYIGLDLWALVLSTLISTLIGRVYGLKYFYDNELKSELKKYKEQEKINYFPIIWYNAKKFGIASFTTYAFTQASILIAGIFLPLKQTAELGLVSQISSLIVTLCRVYYNTFYPKICSLWVSNNIRQIKRIFIKSQLVGYTIWALGFGLLILIGNNILEIIHSKTLLPNNWVIIMYAFFYFMELTHGNCTMLLSSRNSVPFIKASIFACLVSILLMIILSHLEWGIFAFPAAMILANLPYNSWKWTLKTYQLLK